MILYDRIRNWRERVPEEPIKRFAYWIAERHNIYKKKQQGRDKLTDDPILETYKFTNPFREHDRTTVAFRKWTKAHDNSTFGDIIFNTCLFRMIGTSEFFEAHGWVGKDWSPQYTKDLIDQRIRDKQRCFTGAYVITNQGLKLPKGEVVVDHFLRPIIQLDYTWESTPTIIKVCMKYIRNLKSIKGLVVEDLWRMRWSQILITPLYYDLLRTDTLGQTQVLEQYVV